MLSPEWVILSSHIPKAQSQSQKREEKNYKKEYDDNQCMDGWCRRIICILSIVYFNKMLIDQAGSVGGSTRQEVEAG